MKTVYEPIREDPSLNYNLQKNSSGANIHSVKNLMCCYRTAIFIANRELKKNRFHKYRAFKKIAEKNEQKLRQILFLNSQRKLKQKLTAW